MAIFVPFSQKNINKILAQKVSKSLKKGIWAFKITSQPSQPACPILGTDHGTGQPDGPCWGSYAIFVSKDASSFTCQGRTLSQRMN